MHDKKLMDQIKKDCRRNQFYLFYSVENKEEYNQEFAKCGCKFGKESIQLNEKMKKYYENHQ